MLLANLPAHLVQVAGVRQPPDPRPGDHDVAYCLGTQIRYVVQDQPRANVADGVFDQLATGPRISSDSDPQADFANYRSYAFYTPLAVEPKGYSTPASNAMKSAVRREMEARGYVYNESAPDLLVNINAYHQPGVEAGKKAAGAVIDLQGRVLAYLAGKKGHALTSAQIASGIGAHDGYETVFKICEHLAANGRLKKSAGANATGGSYAAP